MVITKAISQRVLVGASIISLLLIAGSIYLHLQQKPHLGRMNTNDGRVKATTTVENPSKNDVIHVPPLHIKPSNSFATKSNYSNSKSHKDYEDIYDEVDYPNDATNSREEKSKPNKATHKSTTVPYLVDNADDIDVDIEYVSPVSEEDTHLNSTDPLGLTQQCFRCLCTTVNRCKSFKCAHIDPCGIYGISKYYWLDGGSPTTTEENDNDYGEENPVHRDYLRCVNNEKCAAETVKNYIRRYQRDCNKDGIIDCRDHIALHILGPTGCFHKELSAIHRVRMRACLK